MKYSSITNYYIKQLELFDLLNNELDLNIDLLIPFIYNLNNVYTKTHNKINHKLIKNEYKLNNYSYDYPYMYILLRNLKINDNKLFIFLLHNTKENHKSILINLLDDNNKYNQINVIHNFSDWIDNYGLNLVSHLSILIKQYDNIKYPEIYQRFIPIDIQYQIEKYSNHTFVYQSNYNNIIVNGTIINNSQSINPQFIELLNKRIILLCLLFNQSNMNYKLWNININKKLDNKITTLGPKHVNTGSTYRGSPYIDLWRQEEIKKVIIHEVGHCFKLEFEHDTQNKEYMDLIHFIYHIFNISLDTDIRLYEAYNESWATILNSIFCNIEYNTEYYISNYKDINKYIYYEICFSCYQTAKIIHYFKFKSFQDFCNIKGFNKKQRNQSLYSESSSILSYYIIRSSLLFNLSEFLNYCYQYNHSINHHIQFNINHFKEFKILIKNSLFNIQYINYINDLLKKMDNIKNNNIEFYKTMRMTVIE